MITCGLGDMNLLTHLMAKEVIFLYNRHIQLNQTQQVTYTTCSLDQYAWFTHVHTVCLKLWLVI